MEEDDITADEYHRRIQVNVLAARYAYRDAAGHAPDFDEATVEWIEVAISSLLEEPEPLDEQQLRVSESMLGAFFGECLLRSFGGRWILVNDDWFAVAIDRGTSPSRTARERDAESLNEDPPGCELIPIPAANDAYRQQGRLLVNPWCKVSAALRGEEGESPVGLYQWVAQELKS